MRKKKQSDKRSPRTEMREQVGRLRDSGMDSEQIARALRISKTTVAAYLAHWTRGTYHA